jgi:uroporphyrinogen decarboxylase
MVLPHSQALVTSLLQTGGGEGGSASQGTPVIHFGVKTAPLLPAIRETGATVVGVSHDVRLGQAWAGLNGRAIMGNLNPDVLLQSREDIRRETARLLAEAAHRPGHIFNLGHGILPQTPEDNVKYLVETVRELSSR